MIMEILSLKTEHVRLNHTRRHTRIRIHNRLPIDSCGTREAAFATSSVDQRL